MKILLFILIAVQAMPSWLNARGPLSISEFNVITQSPGDDVPLRKELREARPFWAASEVVITFRFPNSPSITEKMQIKLKTVKGIHAVFTMYSPSHNRDIHSILSYDEEGGIIIAQSLYGDSIVSGILFYDPVNRIYSGFSHYVRDGVFNEYCVGQYSESEISDRTQVLRDGKLMMTRETKVIPLKK